MSESADDASGDSETTVLVVDDHLSFAELLAAALDNVPGMTCVGTASSASEGIGRAADLRPSIVVMDIQMPGQDGIAATRRIREVAPESVIAVVTAHSDPEWISRAARAGASAFIPKDGSLKEMIDILRRIGPGQMLVASSTFKGPPTRSAVLPTQDVPALTQRELDVLRYLGKGLPAKGIADVLRITLHTCRGYLKSLHNKLGVRSQLEAVIKAQHLGLIGAPDGE